MKKNSEQAAMAWDSFFKVMRGRSYEAVVDPDAYLQELAKQKNDQKKEELPEASGPASEK